MRKSTSWFQSSAQQGVFTKMGTLVPISRSGPHQIITKRIIPKSEDEKYLKVGESIIGEGHEVGSR